VHGDDRGCAGQAGTRDRGVTDTAAADDSHRVAARHAAGVHGRTDPRHDAAAQQAGHCGIGRRVDLRALPGAYQGLVGERPDARRWAELGAVGEGHLLHRVERVDAVLRAAALASTALAAHGAPVQHDEVARLHRVHTLADALNRARGLVTEQERELVVDPAV